MFPFIQTYKFYPKKAKDIHQGKNNNKKKGKLKYYIQQTGN